MSAQEAAFLVIPALLPIVILSVAAARRGIYLAFTDARAGSTSRRTSSGSNNFRELIHDDLFINSFKIGLIWAVSVTAIQFVLCLPRSLCS